MPEKVGLMPCNGMSYIMSTVARDVCRTVAEVLLPGKICFIDTTCILAGLEEEMEVVRKVPILAVDGCRLKCAAKALEKRKIIPHDVMIITDIMIENGLTLRGEDRNRLGSQGQAIVAVTSAETAKRAAGLLDSAV
ncbi:MAG: hypothetical protein GY850_41875 [bacterium]|nr:hypothetical protein [bacterium]